MNSQIETCNIPGCGSQFPSKAGLRHHLETHHSDMRHGVQQARLQLVVKAVHHGHHNGQHHHAETETDKRHPRNKPRKTITGVGKQPSAEAQT